MANFNGTPNDDPIVGTGTPDTIRGKNGNDVIYGYGDGSGVGGTPPPIDPAGGGAADDDDLSGDGGNDTIHGGGGDDIIDGGNNNDTLFGDDGNDTLDGGSGDDTIEGGDGDDLITGGRGNDSLDGGDGSDRYQVGGNNSGIDTYADSGSIGTDSIVAVADDTEIALQDFSPSSGIEEISGNGFLNVSVNGTGGDDRIDLSAVSLFEIVGVFGGDGNDEITGTQAADIIDGEKGNDILNGGEGDDDLTGGQGDDTLDGGEGSDRYLISGRDQGNDTFDDSGASGVDRIVVGENRTIVGLQDFNADSGIEEIDATDFSQVSIAGTTGDDVLDFSATTLIGIEEILGDDGNDTITGSATGDTIDGGKGDDTIDGADGDDTLIGGQDNDTLIGGLGDDTLDGGAGEDVIVYAGSVFGYDLVTSGDGTTVVTDIDLSDGDTGQDTITSGEQIRFSDETIFLRQNNAPLTVGETFTTDEDTAIVIAPADLLANDLDLDGDPLILTAVGNAVNGGVVLDASGITFIPTADFSGAASFDYTVEDGQGGVSVQTVTVDVTPAADAPTLTVQPATGDEDTAILLDIAAALVDTDGSETLSIEISGVPNGANLSAGTDLGSGVWQLTPAELGGLTITPPTNSHDDFQLTVSATSTESKNGDTASTVASLDVVVNSVNDVPVITSPNTASVAENTTAVLQVTATDVEKETESLILGITGNGADDGLFTIDGSGNLSFVDPPDFENPTDMGGTAGDNSYEVEVSASDGLDTTIQTVTVTVTDVDDTAEAPSLTVQPATGDEDTAIALDITAALADTDGSETLTIQISGVPQGAVLSAGSDQGGGIWDLSPGDLAGLTVTPPSNSFEDFTLTITATSTESNGGDTADTEQSLLVTVNSVNDDPVAQDDVFTGDPDVYVSRINVDSELYLNEGDGTLAAPSALLSGFSSHGFDVGDIDGDGSLDAFISHRFNQPARVLTNDGSGVLTDTGQSLGGGDSFDAALGDFDGDGDLDAFVANAFTGNTVWLNDNGVFQDTGQSLGTERSIGVSLGDLNGDGTLDAFVTNGSSQLGSDQVWLNDGDGNFDPGQTFDPAQTVFSALADFDRDGDLDALVTAFGAPDRVWFNNGDGTFIDSGQELGGNALSDGVALGDLDNDGHLDAFVTTRSGNPDRVYFGNGDGTFTVGAQAIGSSDAVNVDLADLDSDGDLDAVIAVNAGSSRVLLNNGDGTYTDSAQALGTTNGFDVKLGDFDQDGFAADAVHVFDVLANDSDPDRTDLATISSVDAISVLGAALSIDANGNVEYDPTVPGATAIQALAEGELAADTFTYTIEDGNGGSDTATVEITVRGVNLPVTEFDLTVNDDLVLPSPVDITVSGNAQTLNSGDDLDGGDGTDALVLFGAGDYDLNDLVNFANFEEVRLVNPTNSSASLVLRDGTTTDSVILDTLGSTEVTLSGSSVVTSFEGGDGQVNILIQDTASADTIDLGNGNGSLHGVINQGSGNVGTVLGGASPDIVGLLGAGTIDEFFAGGADDFLAFSDSNAWNPSVTYDGGDGFDRLNFNASGTFDLRAAALTNVEGMNLSASTTLLVNDAALLSFTRIVGDATSRLETDEATLDLTSKSIIGATVHSSNATGTTFLVDSQATAFQVFGGDGSDTIETSSFAFTAAERDFIFNTSSIETIIDLDGTFMDPNGDALV